MRRRCRARASGRSWGRWGVLALLALSAVLVPVLLLFAAAPILAAVFLRGSRIWVRVLVGVFAAWIWVFWLFLVLVPVTS